MTFAAGHFQVFTFQRPRCFAVVEIYRCPGLISMASRAILPGVIGFRDIALVDILVAIRTGSAQLPESPPFVVFADMAGKTRGGGMGPFKRERRCLVFFQGIETVVEPLCQGVTGSTIRGCPGIFEFPAMVIVMAVRTGRKVDGCRITLLMALAAIHFRMLSYQGIIGFGMVKEIHGSE